jgi:predicted nuclease of predicted toxin-antitoxin system
VILWLDSQISPHLASWLEKTFEVKCLSALRLGLRDASDREIFEAARRERAVVITKDIDFVQRLELHGPPPRSSGSPPVTRPTPLSESC